MLRCLRVYISNCVARACGVERGTGRIAFAISDALSVRMLAGLCSAITVPPFLGWPIAFIVRRDALTGVSFACGIVDSGPCSFAGHNNPAPTPLFESNGSGQVGVSRPNSQAHALVTLPTSPGQSA